MHELSIVCSIIEIVTSEAMAANASSVDNIELEMGTMNGIEMEAFNFAWEQAIPGTLLENATTNIHIKTGMAQCEGCHQSFVIEHFAEPCPFCGSYKKEIVQGQEMQVLAVTITQHK